MGAFLVARAFFAGSDLCVLVCGGEAPHIGCVSIGIPRTSLTGDGSSSATVSTYSVTGHKDDVVGNLFAKRLASSLKCVVSVTCGIHYHNASPEVLSSVLQEAEALLEELVAALE
jgi:hypothetical protein